MTFYRYTGTVATQYPSYGITAQPGAVYDFGSDTPPRERLREGVEPSPLSLWVQVTSPATDFPLAGKQASDLGGIFEQRLTFRPTFYGAIGDGTSHPLSTAFATLAAAKAVYPDAAALTDEIDWAASMKAVRAAEAVGGGDVTWSIGNYVFNRAITTLASNMRFLGSPGAHLTQTVAGVHILSIGPSASDPLVPGNLTWYTMSGSYSPGAPSVTLATPSDAAHFAVGTTIWIRSRNALTGNNFTPIAELNQVTGISGATLTLRYPLSKKYVNDGTYIYGVAVADGSSEAATVVRDTKVSGLSFFATARAVDAHSVINFELANCQGAGNGFALIRGRSIKVHHNRADLTPTWAAGWRPYYLAVDTGSCDILHEDNSYTSTGAGILHIQEGIANLVSQRNTMRQGTTDAAAGGEVWGVASIRAMSWNIKVDDLIVDSPLGNAIDAPDSTAYPTEGNTDISLGCTIGGAINGRPLYVGQNATGIVAGLRNRALSQTLPAQIVSPLVLRRDCDFGATPSLAATVNDQPLLLGPDRFIIHGVAAATALFGTNRRRGWGLLKTTSDYTISTVFVVPQNWTQVRFDLVWAPLAAVTAGSDTAKFFVFVGAFSDGANTNVVDTTLNGTGTALAQDTLVTTQMGTLNVTAGQSVSVRIQRDQANDLYPSGVAVWAMRVTPTTLSA